MKHIIHITICIISISLFSIFSFSCKGNITSTSTDTTGTNKYKMSAKERLAKNNILAIHTNLESYNLKGKVKSVTKTVYDISYDNQKTYNYKVVDLFNAKGYLIEYEDDYDPSQHITNTKTKIMYDANNNDTCRIAYDADGKITGRQSNIYDNKGNEIGYTYYNADGKMDHKRAYKYDDNDNLVEYDNYLENGDLNDKRTYTYDENGFKTGEYKYDSHGKSYLNEKCKYDDKGNILYSKSCYFVDESNNSIDSNKYDGNGHIIEKDQYNGTGNLIVKYTLKFDSFGNITESGTNKIYEGRSEEYTILKQYEYDAAGNIIKESDYMMSKDGKKTLTHITECKIIYY